MVQAVAPKRIWDDALLFEAYARSHTDLDNYITQGEVSETVVLNVNSDISQLCRHGLYDWFMFRDEPIQQPDEKPVLGRNLGPEIGVCL